MINMRPSEEFKRLNPDQLQALDWTRSISIRANAGSGKTSVLIQRIVQILHNDFHHEKALKLDRIVAITFTRKAAAQLRKKLRDALAACFDASAGAERTYWQSRLDELPNCPIGTIDSLCHRILRTAIAEGMIDDVDPAFGILQGIEKSELLELAIERTEQHIATSSAQTQNAWRNWLTTQGRNEISSALKKLLNASSSPDSCAKALEALATIGRERLFECLRLPALAEPLAFFGGDQDKWKRRIADTLAELNVLPDKEQKLASIKKVKEGLDTVVLDTSRSIFATIKRLRDTILTDEGTPRKQGFYAKDLPKSPSLHELTHEWLPMLATWSFDDPGEDGLDLTRQLILLYAEAHRHFRDLCREENRYDFNFLAERATAVLQKAGNAKRLTGHFRYVLVDEFQDTNDLHWQIVSRVAGGLPTEAVISDKLMIVGDPQQSIYRFRQADPTVFSRIIDLIKKGNIQQKRDQAATAYDLHCDPTGKKMASSDEQRLGVMSLKKNYRSLDPLPLGLLDKLSVHAFHEVEFDYQNLEAGKQVTDVTAEVVYLVPLEEPVVEQSETIDDAEDGPVAEPVLDNNQLQLVATELRLLHAKQGFAWKDMAILLRSRATHLVNLEKTLRQHGIPYQLVGGIGFWQRQEVRDLVSLANCLANGADELALFAILRGPLIGLDDSEILFLWTLGGRRLLNGLKRFAQLEKNEDIWPDSKLDNATVVVLREAFAKIVPARRAILGQANDRLGFAGSWRQRIDRMPYADLLRAALDESGAWAIYAAEEDGDRVLANLEMVLDEVRALEADRPGSLTGVARRLKLQVDEAMQEEQAELAAPGGDAVLVMTVHAAKGLEFKVVAVIGLERKFRADSSPLWLLDRFQHLSDPHRDTELAQKLHGLPIISFRNTEMPLAKIKPLLHQAITNVERNLSREEEARVFHVAITRAEQVLLLAGAAKWKSDSWQEWAHQTFGLPETFVEGPFEVDKDPNLRVRIVRKRQALTGKERNADESIPALDLEPLHEAPRRRVIPVTKVMTMLDDRQTKPDEWEMQHRHQVRPHMGPIPRAIIEGTDPKESREAGPVIGTLVHRALELGNAFPKDADSRWQWLHAQAAVLTSTRGTDPDELGPVNGDVESGQWKVIAAQAEKILTNILPKNPFRDLLDAEGDAEVDFNLVLGAWIITGRFDRLIRAENCSLEIVDWKTDLAPAIAIVKKYREQMKLYALALHRSLPKVTRPKNVVVHLAMTHHLKSERLVFAADDLQKFADEIGSRLTQISLDSMPS